MNVSGAGGLSVVTTDSTLTGAGTVASPLKVATPATGFTGPALGGSTQATTIGVATATTPTAAVSGDLLVLLVKRSATDPPTPTGWTLQASRLNVQGSGVAIYVASLALSGAPAANYSIIGTAGNILSWRMLSFHKASGSTLFDAVAQGDSTGQYSYLTSALTTLQPNALAVVAGLNMSANRGLIFPTVALSSAGPTYPSAFIDGMQATPAGADNFGIAGYQVPAAGAFPQVAMGMQISNDSATWFVFDVY
jgi:hypothetical protein